MYDDQFQHDPADADFGPSQPQANVLGIVGFVLAFCLPPLGLLLSLVAALRPPRGFAIAGIIVALLTNGLIAAIGVSIYANRHVIGPMIELSGDFGVVQRAVTAYEQSNGALPTDLGALPELTPALLEDPWGRPYAFAQSQGGGWTLTSHGADGVEGTPDDVELASSMDAWAASQEISRSLQHVPRPNP